MAILLQINFIIPQAFPAPLMPAFPDRQYQAFLQEWNIFIRIQKALQNMNLFFLRHLLIYKALLKSCMGGAVSECLRIFIYLIL